MRQVIYAWNYIEWGGAQIHLFALIREVKKEFDVTVILPYGSDEQLIKFIEDLNVDYEFFDHPVDVAPAKTFRRKISRHLIKIKSEYSMLKYLDKFDLKNSIVHVDIAPWQSLFALIWLSLRTNVFMTMHNSLSVHPRWRYWQKKLKLRIISHFENFHLFASNQDAKNFFKGLYSDEMFDKIAVTYTSVDPKEIDAALDFEIEREKLCARYNLPNDKFLIFCVGQFIDRKGRWTFLEAAKKFHETNKNAAFVWISNSKPSAEDIKKAELYGLGENFILITSDQIGGEHIDLFKLLRLADIFALVSFQEGLPISLLEAMALGIPSISTNVNAIPEAVKHLKTGWLIEVGDVQALVEAFGKLFNDKDLRDKLSSTGRAFVLNNYNDQIVARIVLQEYKKVGK